MAKNSALYVAKKCVLLVAKNSVLYITIYTVLAKWCAQRSNYGPSAKVVVRVKEEEPEKWENCISEYVPPYFSVVNLGIDSGEWTAICEDMIRQCSCAITDFASPDGLFVKELCAKSGDRYLFDLPKTKYQIDEQFE